MYTVASNSFKRRTLFVGDLCMSITLLSLDGMATIKLVRVTHIIGVNHFDQLLNQ